MKCSRCGGSCLNDSGVPTCLLCGKEQITLTLAQEKRRFTQRSPQIASPYTGQGRTRHTVSIGAREDEWSTDI